MKPCLLALLVAFAALPAAPAQEAPPRQKNAISFHIITNDWLIVRVFGEEDLTIKSRVDAEGNIKPQLLDPVNVYGLTLDEAQTKIARAYVDQRMLRHPKVTVTVDQLAPRLVNVTGHVKAPQQYTLAIETPTSLPDIILKAGGFDDTAKGTEVRVTRIMPDGTTKVFGPFDVQSVLRAKQKKASPATQFLVEPGDIVYVPQRII